MAKPYRKKYKSKKLSWTLEEISELYIEKNFSMDLISEVSGIDLPTLSRILQKYKLPQKKLVYYNGHVAHELKAVPENELDAYFQVTELAPGMKKTAKDLEDDFFREIGC